MNGVLERFGAGAIVAWLVLPILSLSLWRARQSEARSRERALRLGFVLSVAFFFAPFVKLPQATPVSLRIVTPVLRVGGRAMLHADPAPAWLSPFAWIALCWLGLCMVGVVLLVRRLWRLSRLSRMGLPVPPTLAEKVNRLAIRLGVRPPHLVFLEQTALPFVAGALHPFLVVPRWAVDELSDDALELVLRHELTHLARRDLHWGLLVGLLRIPFTGHPVARWLSHELALAREEEVDRRVAGGSEAPYARLLLKFAERANSSVRGDSSWARGEASVGGGSLGRRIDRLALPTPRRASPLPVLGLALALGALAVLLPGLGLAQGDRNPVVPEPLNILLAPEDIRHYRLSGIRAVSGGVNAVAELKVVLDPDQGDPVLRVRGLHPGYLEGEVIYEDGCHQRLNLQVVSNALQDEERPIVVRFQAGGLGVEPR